MSRFAADSLLAVSVDPSPNHGPRRGDRGIDAIILHYTGMPGGGSGALAWLRNPASEVSSHYFIAPDGTITQLVPEVRRAWHAGVSFWQGERDLNSCSMGIEIDNPGHAGGLPPFPLPQIEATIALCRDICGRHPIPAERVLAHSDIAPSRKQDPGEVFPWAALHAAGVGHWVTPVPLGTGPAIEPPAIIEMQAALARYGYEIDVSGRYDAPTARAVRAFQRHFRPARVDGIADASTLATLSELIAALPRPSRTKD